jgi:hypothetical protein
MKIASAFARRSATERLENRVALVEPTEQVQRHGALLPCAQD